MSAGWGTYFPQSALEDEKNEEAALDQHVHAYCTSHIKAQLRLLCLRNLGGKQHGESL